MKIGTQDLLVNSMFTINGIKYILESVEQDKLVAYCIERKIFEQIPAPDYTLEIDDNSLWFSLDPYIDNNGCHMNM